MPTQYQSHPTNQPRWSLNEASTFLTSPEVPVPGTRHCLASVTQYFTVTISLEVCE